MSDMSFEAADHDVNPQAHVPRRVDVDQKVPKNPNYLKRVGASAALVGVLGGVAYTGIKIREYEISGRNNKLGFFQNLEETQLNNARKIPVKLSQNVVILEAGVVYRDTPFSINASRRNLGFISLKGNVAGKVPTGQEQILAKPWVYTDPLNNTWMGFRFGDGTVSTTPKSPKEVADDMVWVNASKLGPNDAKIAARKSATLLNFSVATLREHVQGSTLDVYGQFISDAKNPIAWAPPAEKAGTYDFIHRADMA